MSIYYFKVSCALTVIFSGGPDGDKPDDGSGFSHDGGVTGINEQYMMQT